MTLAYKAGYKYQLVDPYTHQLGEGCPHVSQTIELDFLRLGTSGALTVKRGYAWDGPSGPTVDTKNFMRGSLVHDALYELIRLGYLDKNIYRVVADRELYRLCRLDGMSRLRAAWIYYGVRVGGNPAARRSGEPPVLSAP